MNNLEQAVIDKAKQWFVSRTAENRKHALAAVRKLLDAEHAEQDREHSRALKMRRAL